MSNISNDTNIRVEIEMDPQSDAIWILSSTFIVFTMQSGFGLLESGSVSVKNELNIMVKNAVDVIFGGLTYWMFGYGLSFGDSEYSNPVVGWGYFFVNADEDKLGIVYSKFFFQASFATTATTIVSGAMAERTKLTSYMLFSMFNTILFCIPAHWVWASNGWLYTFGVVDIAGAGPVHVVGGVTGLVATLILKPRHGRYFHGTSKAPQMSSPTNAVLGMFMLWWGWLGFNCGSTFGISGLKWKLAAQSAASTLCSSVSGGVAGFLLSYIVKNRKFDVTYMINGLLGALVSITAVCAIVQPWEGLVIGFIGSVITNACVALLDRLRIDDPVGCVGTHAISGIWGMLAAGFFIRDDTLINSLYLHHATAGLFYGGGFRQLGVQTLAVVAITVWTLIMSFIVLKLLDVLIGLRVSLAEEIIGADIVEHGIGDMVYDRKTGALTYPPGDPGSESQANGRQAEARRANFSRASVNGRTHLLGHSGRRRTLNEINLDLSKEAELVTEAFDLTTPIEEEIPSSSHNSYTYTRNCKHLSPSKMHPNTTSKSSVLSHLRETLLPRSLKNRLYRTDQNENTDILNSSHQSVIPSEPRLRTASLQLQKCTRNDPPVKKYSTDSISGSSFGGYGTLSEGLPSTNTISIELSDNESSSDIRNDFQNNTSFNSITHF